MMSVEEIREGMKDRRVYEVAKKTGLNVRTIYNLLNDKAANPKLNTVRVLERYLKGDMDASVE